MRIVIMVVIWIISVGIGLWKYSDAVHERDSWKKSYDSVYGDLKIEGAKCVKDDTVISWLEINKKHLEQQLTECRATHNTTFDKPVNEVHIGDVNTLIQH